MAIVHWLYVQRSRLWALARHVRRMLAGPLAPNADQITNQLFVGGFIDRHDWAALQAQGITVDVNLQAERCDQFGRGQPVSYLWLPTMDHSPPDQAALRMGVGFVQAALQDDRKVLIHCHAGKGRSALLCTAVLVAEGMGVDAAWRLVKSRRAVAHLHPPQRQALEQFAAEWADQRAGIL